MTDDTNGDVSIQNPSLDSSPDQLNSFEHIQTEHFNSESGENQSDSQTTDNEENQNHLHPNQQQTDNEQQQQPNQLIAEDFTTYSNEKQLDQPTTEHQSTYTNEQQSDEVTTGDHSTSPNEHQLNQLVSEDHSTNNEDQFKEVISDDQSTSANEEQFNEVISEDQSTYNGEQLDEVNSENQPTYPNEEQFNEVISEDESISTNEDQSTSRNEEHLDEVVTGDQSSSPNEQQSNEVITGDQSTSPNEQQSNEVISEDQSSSPNEEHLDGVNGQHQLSVPDEEQFNQANHSNSQRSSNGQIDFDQQSLKNQRQIDEDEMVPAELPVDQTEETPVSSIKTETKVNDILPLTPLEDPFEHKRQEETQYFSIENPADHSNNSSPNEIVITEENPLKNATLSSFLADADNETIEDDSSVETNLANGNPNSTEINPDDFTSEDFPPLSRTQVPVHEMIHDEQFPPLNCAATTDQQQHAPLSSNQQDELEPPVDILKNKSLLKQTLVKGETNSRPTRSTMVTISYTLTLVETLNSNSRLIETVSNEKYFVGERDLIAAIDVSVLLMDRGEVALIESDVRHCYGEQGCAEKHIPPVTTVNPYKMKIEIELHDWIAPADIQLLPVQERIFWSDKKKTNGNFHYRRQDYKISLDCYNGASRFLDLDVNPVDSSVDQNQINVLIDKYVQVQNNIAQVYLLSNKYQECLNAVQNVFKLDPKNVKALFRQGKALFELGKYQEAIQSLKTFLQIERTNPNTSANVDLDKANEMIRISEQKLANYQKNEREIYQRMFRPSSANNQQQTKPQTLKQNVDSNTNWLPYIALGAAAFALAGYVVFNKYGKHP